MPPARKQGTTVNVNVVLKNFPDGKVMMDKIGAKGLSRRLKSLRKTVLRLTPVLTGFMKASWIFSESKRSGNTIGKITVENTASYAKYVEKETRILDRQIQRVSNISWKNDVRPITVNWRKEASASESEIRKWVKSKNVTIRRGR